MRIAVLSDIHANLHALQAVHRDLAAQDVQETWCLGDVVGYGGHPRECLAWVEEHADLVVKGNHDEAVATGDVTWFNPMAAHAARVHAQKLTPPERSTIYGWSPSARREIAGQTVLVVHASPDDPLHEYVQPQDARLGLRRWEERADVILLGHTHRPFAARLHPSEEEAWRPVEFLENIADKRQGHPLLLLNPGSVGQPRDGDPRASYAILDFARKTAELRRVVYDVEAAAQAIRREGLDQLLALRLYEGR
ncbi:MAG TPA: metallophosphoesterase family protein [Candidatus Thermoplasmatota archaeon]|nr:metallophosphoesterase family protein [Candidatus Thermoplasmatota archaeon]